MLAKCIHAEMQDCMGNKGFLNNRIIPSDMHVDDFLLT